MSRPYAGGGAGTFPIFGGAGKAALTLRGDLERLTEGKAFQAGESLPAHMSSTVGGTFEKVLRFGEGRRVKRLQQQAAYIATLEPEFQALSDDELRAKTISFRERYENGESLDELIFEAFAAVREARWRESQQRMFDVQMMGGIVLHEGDIAEMKTGEGKTFVASAPLYLNALAGTGVHLVTVNDYLAKRDAEWNRGVFDRLGMTVGFIQNMSPAPMHSSRQSLV